MRRSFFASILLSAFAVPALAAPDGDAIWRRALGDAVAAGATLTDCDVDGAPDLVVSTADGYVAALRADAGAVLWRRRVAESPLTPPVAAAFVDPPTVDIVVGAIGEGRLFRLSSATGDEVGRVVVGELAVPLLSLSPRDSRIEGGVEAVTIALRSGRIAKAEFGPPAQVLWFNDLEDRARFAPQTLLNPRDKSSSILAAPEIGAFQAIDDLTGRRIETDDSGDRDFERMARAAALPPAIADLDGDGAQDMILADREGHVRAFEWKSGQAEPMWSSPRRFASFLAVLAGDFVPDEGVEVAVAQERRLWLLGARGEILLVATLSDRATASWGLIAPESPQGAPRLSFLTAEGAFVVYALQTDESGDLSLARRLRLVAPFPPSPDYLVGDADGDRRADIFLTNRERGEVCRLATPLKIEERAMPWLGPQGNPFRTASLDPAYHERRREQLDRIRSRLKGEFNNARTQYQFKMWRGAIRDAELVLGWNPNHTEAKDILFKAKWQSRKWLLKWGLTILTGALLVAGTVHLGFNVYRRVVWRLRARHYEKSGRFDEALPLYLALSRLRPRDEALRRRCLELITEYGYAESDAIPLLERACANAPDDPAPALALAQAYLNESRYGEKAMRLYERVRPHYDPQWLIEEFMGQVHAGAGRNQQAISLLEAAFAHGCDDEDSQELLARLHLAEGRAPTTLARVYARLAMAEPDDIDLLEAACRSGAAAGAADETSVALYERMVEADPSNASALAALGAVRLQNRETGEAMEFAQRASAAAPDDPSTRLLVARCCLALGREDADAMTAVEQAWDAHPDDEEILLGFARLCGRAERADPKASSALRRALALRPDDLELLAAAANAAEREGDTALLVQSLEALVTRLGANDDATMARLGLAYRDAQVAESKAREAYEAARRRHPDDKQVRRLLGAIYARDGVLDERVVETLTPLRGNGDLPQDLRLHLAEALSALGRDAEALEVVEELGGEHAAGLNLLRIRARAFLATERFEEAAALCEEILVQTPDDAETLATYALACDSAQRRDRDAIKVYNRALSANPDRADLALVVARVHADQGSPIGSVKALRRAVQLDASSREKAVEHCFSLLERHPHEVEVHSFLVHHLTEAGEFEEAAEEIRSLHSIDAERIDELLGYCDRILARDPNHVPTLVVRAILCRDRGDASNARVSAERALESDPGCEEAQEILADIYQRILSEREDVETRFKLGRVYLASDCFDDAINCFQACRRERYRELDCSRLMGRTFLRKGLPEIALTELQGLSVDDEEMKETLYELGQTFETQDDPRSAMLAYQRLVAADIGYRDAQERLDAMKSAAMARQTGAASHYTGYGAASGVGSVGVGLTTGGGRTTGSSGSTTAYAQTGFGTREDAAPRYQLIKEVGRGSMGIVYRARDRVLNEIVALKLLPENLANNPTILQRFKAEARSTRRLTHSNIVRIHDIGEEGGRKYISMEFVEGSDLGKIIEKRRLKPREALTIALETAGALAYAHSMNVIHRDIKPANIMVLRDRQVKITDFGIAKALEDGESTRMGVIMGTPMYMSPEQCLGKEIDQRADIYSLGVVLYEMLSGRPPFPKGDFTYHHVHSEPPALSNTLGVVAEIVMKCLAKEPNDRFRDAVELQDALRDALSRLPT